MKRAIAALIVLATAKQHVVTGIDEDLIADSVSYFKINGPIMISSCEATGVIFKRLDKSIFVHRSDSDELIESLYDEIAFRGLIMCVTNNQTLQEAKSLISSSTSLRNPSFFICDDMINLCSNLFESISVGSNILFIDAQTQEVIEAYNINEELIVNKIAKIQKDSNLLTDQEMVANKRRSNFLGQEIRILTESQEPQLMFSKRFDEELEKRETMKTPTGDLLDVVPFEDIRGAFVDVVGNLQNDLNFTPSVFRRRDRGWAAQDEESGEWKGMAASVHKGEADLVCAALTNIAYRLEVFDFLPGLDTETTALAITKKEVKNYANWDMYFAPFTDHVWFQLVAASLLLGTTLTVMRCYLLNDVSANKNSKRCMEVGKSMAGNWWSAFASNFGVDMTKLSSGQTASRGADSRSREETPIRLLLLSVFLAGNVVFMTYRAALTSELSVRRLKLPFRSLAEMQDTDYKLITYSYGQSYFEELRLAPPNTTFGKIYQKHFTGDNSDRLYAHAKDALKYLVETPDTTYYMIKEVVGQLEEYRCQLIYPWVTTAPNVISMAVGKNSPYLELFRYHTMKILEDGRFKKGLALWDTAANYVCDGGDHQSDAAAAGAGDSFVSSSVDSLSLKTLVWLFGMLLAAAAVAVIVFTLELAARDNIQNQDQIVQRKIMREIGRRVGNEVDFLRKNGVDKTMVQRLMSDAVEEVYQDKNILFKGEFKRAF